MKTSLFEIFKIGIGPSSSHTMGPMRAASAFAAGLRDSGTLEKTARVEANLYGSLALTGLGHGTDRAVLLGLSGELPDLIAPESIEPKLAAIRTAKSLPMDGSRTVAFDETTDLLFHKNKTLPFHSNGMRYRAFDAVGTVIAEQVYFSIGGGFILREGETVGAHAKASVRYPFTSAAELLETAAEHGMAVWQIALEDEKAWHSEAEIREYVHKIWKVMQGCIARGLKQKESYRAG